MEYSEKIYSLRQDKKISQEELAEQIGTSRQIVSRWERGVSIPTMKYAARMAEYFGISVDELMNHAVVESGEKGVALHTDDSAEKTFQTHCAQFAFSSVVVVLVGIILNTFASLTESFLFHFFDACYETGKPAGTNPSDYTGGLFDLDTVISLRGFLREVTDRIPYGILAIVVVILVAFLLSLCFRFKLCIDGEQNKLTRYSFYRSFLDGLQIPWVALVCAVLYFSLGNYFSLLPDSLKLLDDLIKFLLFCMISVFLVGSVKILCDLLCEKVLEPHWMLVNARPKEVRLLDKVYACIALPLSLLYLILLCIGGMVGAIILTICFAAVATLVNFAYVGIRTAFFAKNLHIPKSDETKKKNTV